MNWLLRLFLLGPLLACAMSSAQAQEHEPAQLIVRANAALDAGDYPRAEQAVQELIARGMVRRAERAEAYRILGLLKFYEQSTVLARAAFLEYLLLEPDAHLDPALVPPEAITLLEDVRSNHLAEIEAMRPAPRKKRYLMLNLVPAGGQIQNGQNTKAMLVASGFVLLVAGNIGSYLLLRDYCDDRNLTCSKNGVDKTETARDLQAVNLLSGVGLISLYAFSIVDGYLGYRKLEARDRERQRQNDMSLHVSSTSEATTLSLSFRY